MDFIVSFLSGLFNKFRIANPVAAAVVLLVLSVLTFGAMQGEVLGLFKLEGVVQQLVSAAGMILTAIIGGGSATSAPAKN